MSLLTILLQVPFLPEQASSFAQEVDMFYLSLWALTIFFSVAVAVAALFFMLKYRRRRIDEIPEQVEGAMALEITWTVIPFIISLFIFGWGAKIYYQMYTEPKDAMEIFVTGKQWMWRAQHPDGIREINQLHLPLGKRIKLTMTSEDVLHAYFIPAFRTKANVVPGRYTMTWFTPTKAGTYHLFCAEYCGTQHSGMIGNVIVLEPSEYQQWLAGGPKEASPSATGQKLFASLACNTCHYDKDGGRGPSLAGVFGSQVKLENGTTVIADEGYLRESILNPGAKIVAGFQPVMPTFQGQLSEEQVLQLIAYIKSIGAQEGAVAAKPAASPAPPTAKASPGAPTTPAPAAQGGQKKD